MKLRDLMVGVSLKGGWADPELEINSISTGTEEDLRGSVFVELPGSGLTAEQAMERGAAVALSGGKDPWETLGRLAGNLFCHPARAMTLVAVAGKDDSDLVAHLMRVMLEGMPHTKVGAITPEGVWLRGVALPFPCERRDPVQMHRLLRRMADDGCTHVVVHMDDAGVECRAYAGLRMSVTALTGPVRSREALFGLLRSSDTVVLNLDEKDWEDYADIIPEHTFTYSENKTCADLTAKNLRLFPGHMEFEAVAVGHVQRIHLPVPGGFALYHGLCALSCGVCLGLKWERMARVLRCVHGPGGRLEVLSVPAAYTVVLDRAQTPQNLEMLLTSAREFTAGQLVCVLGCPEHGSAVFHAQLGSVAEQLSDRVILTVSDGPAVTEHVRSGMGAWKRPCMVEPDRRKAVRYALEQAGPGDVVVLAGVPRDEVRQADEREFIRSCVSRRSICTEKRTPVRG